MKRALLALTLGALIVSCGDNPSGPGDPPTNGADFAFDQASYAPFEAVVVTLSGAVVPADEIEATLGDTPVVMTATTDSTLVLLAPADAGTYSLAFELDDETLEGELVVTQGVVDDPVAYVDDVADAASAAIDSVVALLGADSAMGAQAIAYADIAADSLAAFRARFATMTADEQAAAAAFLAANIVGRPTLNAILDIEDNMMEGITLVAGTPFPTSEMASRVWIPENCRDQSVLLMYQCTWSELGKGLERIAIYYIGAYGAAKLLIPIAAPVGVGVAGVIGGFAMIESAFALRVLVNLVKWHGLAAWELGAEAVHATAGYFRADVSDLESAAGPHPFPAAAVAGSLTAFADGVPVTFTLAPQVRRVAAADRELPFLTLALTSIEKINEVLDLLGAPLLTFAPPSTAYLDPVPAAQVDVEVVSGDVEVAQFEQSGEAITIAFSATADAGTTFVYDLIYSSEAYEPVRIRYEAAMDDSIALYAASAPGDWTYYMRRKEATSGFDHAWTFTLYGDGTGILTSYIAGYDGGTVTEENIALAWRIERDQHGYHLIVDDVTNGYGFFGGRVEYPVTRTEPVTDVTWTSWAEKSP